jgi:enoyl-CoA hydratase/carnithine racemase
MATPPSHTPATMATRRAPALEAELRAISNKSKTARLARQFSRRRNGKVKMGTLVNYATDKGVALLTLNDPPVNAYTHEMFKELDANILEARFDDDVYVIIITGHGDKYFCAGANINMLKEAGETFKYYFCLHANETLQRLENTPKLTLAALNGHCVGGGFEVALACDLRIARAGAYQVGLPEVSLGVLPGTGGTQRLTRVVGKARAIEMMVEGQALPVEDARAAGLVHKVWDAEGHDEFLRRVIAYAHGFCPPGRASLAVGAIKRAVQSGADMSLEQGLALERELQQQLFRSHDAKEGLVAFTQKRKAQFHGR